MDYSPPGSSLHGILQARILEWIAISFSRASSQPRDWTGVSCIAGRRFILWATREDLRKVWSLSNSWEVTPSTLNILSIRSGFVYLGALCYARYIMHIRVWLTVWFMVEILDHTVSAEHLGVLETRVSHMGSQPSYMLVFCFISPHFNIPLLDKMEKKKTRMHAS